MELDPKEQSDGMKWLFGAGIAALAICSFLMFIDNTLSNSDREKQLGQTLQELRGAQRSLPTGVNEPRQTMPFLGLQSYDVEPQVEVEAEAHHPAEHSEEAHH